MPWVISGLFHVGVALVMMFVALILHDVQDAAALLPQQGHRIQRPAPVRLTTSGVVPEGGSGAWGEAPAPDGGRTRPDVQVAVPSADGRRPEVVGPDAA